MNKLLVSVILVIGLSACASKGTFTSNGNEQRFAQDRANCRIAMNQNFPTNSIVSAGALAQYANIKQQNEATDFFNDCMTAKGYSQTSANQKSQRAETPVAMSTPAAPVAINNSRFICIPRNATVGYKAKLVDEGTVWVVTGIVGEDRKFCTTDTTHIVKAVSVFYAVK